ncbi:MAG TPA: CARDB domain-containing protein [Chloroflexota bacterium]|nr:CARDB domain-containing protein [Chloroflexota bacterium]
MEILGTAWRPIVALALTATLLTSAFGPPAPVGAAEPPEIRARLELVVKEVNIIDNRDPWISGTGETSLEVGIWQCGDDVAVPCHLETRLARAGTFMFGVDDGEVVTLNLEVPQAGDVNLGEGTSREHGFPVYPGRKYAVWFEMEEWDETSDTPASLDDHMGYVTHLLDDGEHGLGVGTHTRRSVRGDGVSPGDFVVTYEIRRVPLPDLAPVSIKVHDLPGSAKKQVCMTVVNRGDVHASTFVVNLSVNGNVPADGLYTVGVLGAGLDYLTCVVTTLPTSGQFELAAVVDKARAVTEYNEANNVHRQTFTATPPSSSSSSSSSTSPGQADLTVNAIRVRDQVPDGKDDCKDGKNPVVVVVKNGGTGKAEQLAVRLKVDGGEAVEETVDSLEPGQERQVRFDEVRLKKGEHTLTATVAAKSAVAEANEDDNDLKVTARCQDDD